MEHALILTKGWAVMRRLVGLFRQPEFHIFLFCLMLILANWPFLAVAGGNGLKSMFLYLYGLWSALILVLFLIQKSNRSKASDEDGDGRNS